MTSAAHADFNRVAAAENMAHNAHYDSMVAASRNASYVDRIGMALGYSSGAFDSARRLERNACAAARRATEATLDVNNAYEARNVRAAEAALARVRSARRYVRRLSTTLRRRAERAESRRRNPSEVTAPQ